LILILFHLQPTILPGGFLGVDVFFVISGYLISGIILRESHLGTFSFAHFYARRVKRIFPALFVVLFISSFIAVFLLTPETYVNYMKSARYASAQLANLFFAQNVGYFEEGFSGQPLLHTWSLGVEEQFYLVWPLLIYLCFRTVRRHGEQGVTQLPLARQVSTNRSADSQLGIVLAILFFASYGLCYMMAETSTNLAFYMFYTRAFEFSIGGGLALSIVPQISSAAFHRFAGFSGVVLITASFLVVRQEFVGGSFLRYGTLITCAGTALLIYSNAEKSVFNRLLAGSIPVAIGRISYSLYLFHWPVIIFWKQYSDQDELTLGASLVIIAVSFGLSALSYFFVEQPARKSSWSDRKVLLSALAVIVLFAVSFRLLEEQEVASWRITPYGDSETADQKYIPDCPRHAEDGVRIFDCSVEKNPARPVVALVGDSHSGHYFCSVSEWAKKNGYGFKYLGIAGCPMLLGDFAINSSIKDEHGTQCKSAQKALVEGVLEDPEVELVLIAQRYDLLYDGKGYQSLTRLMQFEDSEGEPIEHHTEYYSTRLLATIDSLRENGKDVAVFGQVPLFRNVEACNWQPLIERLLSKDRVCSYDLDFIDSWQQPSMSFIKEFTAENQLTYFDPFLYLDQPLKNGLNLYRNIDHLNDQGCLYLSPFVFEMLDQLTSEPKEDS